MRGYYTLEVRDKEGRVLKSLKGKTRSFVRQYLDIVYLQMTVATSYSIKDTGGADRDAAANAFSLQAPGSLGSTERGIVVGTDATAVTISDYAMRALIASGTAAGELEYKEQTWTDPAVSGSEISFTAQRLFTNNSGATITAKEIGIQAQFYGDAGTRYALIVRDVLASTIDVPHESTLTVTYTIKVVV